MTTKIKLKTMPCFGCGALQEVPTITTVCICRACRTACNNFEEMKDLLEEVSADWFDLDCKTTLVEIDNLLARIESESGHD